MSHPTFRSCAVTYRRPNGSTGGMVAESIDSAREYAQDRANDYGLAAEIACWDVCSECRGAGTVPQRGKRNRFLTRVCPACKGNPETLVSREVIEPLSVAGGGMLSGLKGLWGG